MTGILMLIIAGCATAGVVAKYGSNEELSSSQEHDLTSPYNPS